MNNYKRQVGNTRKVHVDQPLAEEKKLIAIKYYNKALRKEKRSSRSIQGPGTTANYVRLSNQNNSYKYHKKQEKIGKAQQQQQIELQEIEKRKLEKARKEEAVRKRKESRLAKFKQLNRRTSKGQPIMKHRMDLLLKQIEKQVND